MKNQKIENIRVNQALSDILINIPKNTSYSEYLLDKIARLEAHESHAVCWVVVESDTSSNRMSVGNRNGSSPVLDEIIEIVDEIPSTNISHEDRSNGWLGSNGDCSEYAHGGFASIEAAIHYVKNVMYGRKLPRQFRTEFDENEYIFTTAQFDEYWFVEDWLDADEPDVTGLNDNGLKELALKLEKEANASGIGICGDIFAYLKDLQSE